MRPPEATMQSPDRDGLRCCALRKTITNWHGSCLRSQGSLYPAVVHVEGSQNTGGVPSLAVGARRSTRRGDHRGGGSLACLVCCTQLPRRSRMRID